MTDHELSFLSLCAPLEDAVDLLNRGDIKGAKALLERILETARKEMEQPG